MAHSVHVYLLYIRSLAKSVSCAYVSVCLLLDIVLCVSVPVLLFLLAVLDPRVSHTMDVLSLFISVL